MIMYKIMMPDLYTLNTLLYMLSIIVGDETLDKTRMFSPILKKSFILS